MIIFLAALVFEKEMLHSQVESFSHDFNRLKLQHEENVKSYREQLQVNFFKTNFTSKRFTADPVGLKTIVSTVLKSPNHVLSVDTRFLNIRPFYDIVFLIAKNSKIHFNLKISFIFYKISIGFLKTKLSMDFCQN